jgi:hypothetical protein
MEILKTPNRQNYSEQKRVLLEVSQYLTSNYSKKRLSQNRHGTGKKTHLDQCNTIVDPEISPTQLYPSDSRHKTLKTYIRKKRSPV